MGKDSAWSIKSIPLRGGAWGKWGEWVCAKSRSWKKRKKSVLYSPKAEHNWLKLANWPSMYRSPRHLRPLFPRAAKRESILAGPNKWLLQRGVVCGGESHPNHFLIWVQIFKVLTSMGFGCEICYILAPGETWYMNSPLTGTRYVEEKLTRVKYLVH